MLRCVGAGRLLAWLEVSSLQSLFSWYYFAGRLKWRWEHDWFLVLDPGPQFFADDVGYCCILSKCFESYLLVELLVYFNPDAFLGHLPSYDTMYIVSYLGRLVNSQIRMQTLKFSLIVGLPLGWLVLWDTGLIHRRDLLGVVLQVLVMLAGVALAWLWLRYWERVVAWLDWLAGCKR